ncbi:MAG TPA: LacI family DNA-binding transcriptional regulator [Saprospiraceae bacterium]|nr:LacI family DNA-binding transcriptional regulator [Saprospiraceae bacterium]
MRINYTIHDIAKELSIAPSTVSRALKDHPRISEKTRKEIQAFAKKVNYKQNSLASALRSGKSGFIGVCLPTTNRNFFANVIKGIEEVANKRGNSIFITQSNEDFDLEKKNIDTLIRAGVDGILISVSRNAPDSQYYKDIFEQGTPIFFFDRSLDETGINQTVIDDYQAAYQATQHLIDQGYRRIVHFAGLFHTASLYRERQRGYKQAIYDAGLEADVLFSKLQLNDGKEHMQNLLARDVKPDAIFSASDYAALGAMMVLKENNIKIGTEVGLIGFANEPFTEFVDPPLSTVDQKAKSIGEHAVSSLLNYIDAPETYIFGKTVLTPQLIIRSSSIR